MSQWNQRSCTRWADKLALRPNDLSPTEYTILQKHLAACPACATTFADYQALHTRLRALPDPAPPSTPFLWPELFLSEHAEERKENTHVKMKEAQTMESNATQHLPVKTRWYRLVAAVLVSIVLVGAVLAGSMLLQVRLNPLSSPAGKGAAPTPIPTVEFARFATQEYAIEFPPTWEANNFTLTDLHLLVLNPRDALSGNTFLSIRTEAQGNPGSPLDRAQSLLSQSGKNRKNFQKQSVPTTVTINGLQWAQVAATMVDSKTGVPLTIYVLATPLPSDATKLVSLTYSAPTSQFDQINTQDFQRMLLSLTFL